jgi:hypothetical protein
LLLMQLASRLHIQIVVDLCFVENHETHYQALLWGRYNTSGIPALSGKASGCCWVLFGLGAI